jgi:hypothetical protein
VSGKDKSGKFGNINGLGVSLNSGKLISKLALILCKSRIISGHLGNSITGICGTTALTSSHINVIKSFLSFLHSLQDSSYQTNMSTSNCQDFKIDFIKMYNSTQALNLSPFAQIRQPRIFEITSILHKICSKYFSFVFISS